MPPYPPSKRLHTSPTPWVLPADTQLWRVHTRRHPATDFNPTPRDRPSGGGRFDGGTAGDAYPYAYLAMSQETALTEKLVRGLPFGDRQVRFLPRAEVRDQLITAVESVGDLTLLDLRSTRALAMIGQDEWLVQCDSREYPYTREWASWLRGQLPWAQGFVWRSKRDTEGTALILFGDRCPEKALRPGPTAPIELDTTAGAAWLRTTLRPYRVTIRDPR